MPYPARLDSVRQTAGLTRRVLVVESDALLSEAIGARLQTETFFVRQVHNHASAVELIDSVSKSHGTPSPWDVVFVDLRPGTADTIDLIKLIRSKGISCPIIACSDIDSGTQFLELLNGGASHTLEAPISIAEVVARTKALCRRFTRHPRQTVEFADMTIDLATSVVTRNGTVVRLTKAECTLLLTLLKYQGKIVSRTQLFEEAFGRTVETSSNALGTLLTRLRRKIERTGPRLIRSVYGQGYLIRRPPAKIPT